jgi:methyltransferase OMS1
LEVAAGTARNLDLYQHVDELVFVDLSTDMLEQAQHKFKGQKARLIKANAEALPFQDQTFDVVIDTFGLCSCQDPVAMLKEMKRVGKRVLLLEHGQSHYPWLNQFMNRTAIQHYHHWGCWWNRDIVSLIQQSGLRILHSERKHFGTTFFIVAE